MPGGRSGPPFMRGWGWQLRAVLRLRRGRGPCTRGGGHAGGTQPQRFEWPSAAGSNHLRMDSMGKLDPFFHKVMLEHVGAESVDALFESARLEGDRADYLM